MPFLSTDYPFGIRLSRRVDGRRLATFNARNEHDRCKFAEDLRESIAEMDEMEAMRIEGELNRGKGRGTGGNTGRNGGLSLLSFPVGFSFLLNVDTSEASLVV